MGINPPEPDPNNLSDQAARRTHNRRPDDPTLEEILPDTMAFTERKEVEELVRFQANLLNKVGESVIATGPEGRIIYWNRAAEGIYGWSSEEAMGQMLRELVVSEDLRDQAEEMRATLTAGSSWSGEFTVRRKDGTSIPVLGTATPVFDERGRPVGNIGVSMDVTERKEAEEALKKSEERFRSLIQKASDVITIVGADGTILYDSPAVERVLGYEPEERVGTNAFDYVQPDDLEQGARTFEEILGTPGTHLTHEFRWPRKDGSLIQIEVTLTNLLGDPAIGGIVANWRDITERKRAGEALKESERYLRTVVGNVPVVLFALDSDGVFTLFEGKGLQALGLRPGEYVGRSVFEEYRDVPGVSENVRRVLGGEEIVTTVEVDDAVFEVFYNPLRDEGGEVVGVIGVAGDVTEHKRAEDLIKRQAALLEQTHDAVFMWKLGGEIIYWNPGAERLYGWSKEEALGRISHELLKTVHPFSPEELDLRLRTEGHWEGELVHHTRDEQRVVVQSRHVLTCYDSGPGFVLETNQDITERKWAEERLVHQAFHDLLTDLPNRQLFVDRLQQAFRRTERRRDRMAAVLFMDLDGFKVVNDSLGHEIGDRLLVEVAGRLKDCLRAEDTLSRFGGDEFTVLVEEVEAPEDAVRVADRIAGCFREPFVVHGSELFVGASIGIALGSASTKGPEEMLRDADTAMYRAKEEGSGYRLFDPKMYERVLDRLRLENDIRRAIRAEEFVVHYQPIVSLTDGEVRRVEALVRWEHPKRGFLNPDEFIPVAEETGLVVPVGEGVLKEACRQGQRWREEHPEIPPLVISVNLSARQLTHPDFVKSVEGVLRETGFEARCLSLDVTETVYIEVLEGNTSALDGLKKLGVSVSIDDFGVGYSSLSYLKRLPADVLKIDKSFVAGIGEEVEDTRR